MKQLAISAALAALLTFALGPAHAVTFPLVPVEDAGNGDDPATGYGGVSYNYRISDTEVTNAMYTEFLNAIADDDPNGVWNANMDITRSGSAGSYTYTVVGGFEDHPINQASFFDAMRFVNWVENGQPTGAQDASTTEDGTYLISDGSSEVRSADATYFLPSEDEWYKAAYYDGAG
ncbi:MAG: SUMF1/EgtB/PvdO family nonheme iron enzyme, partial [Planctomycetales bacterium]|nr:SUMF1/EgtB/PvdO family nonheme iron enzyme [Planctomycetales bacterium]NIP68801.1 SUMF1/EgtB/PvdO family nonheme iron enzyme [Planctomycetales bacterium]